jgi:hypothetical protein
LTRIEAAGHHAAIAVVCQYCGWQPDKEAAKSSAIKAKRPIPASPMERFLRDQERDQQLDDLLELRRELES